MVKLIMAVVANKASQNVILYFEKQSKIQIEDFKILQNKKEPLKFDGSFLLSFLYKKLFAFMPNSFSFYALAILI